MIKTRKISKILFTVISVMMFAPRIAQGLIIGSGTPTIDGLTDGAMSVDFTATTLKTTVMGYVKTVQENLQLIKSRYEQYKNDFIGVMNGENKSPIPGTRTIEDSQLAASDDPTAVQRAIYDLFMTYPSSDYKSKQVCDKKLTQFYIDTIIEINTAAQKLEQEFNNELKPKVENLTSDIMGGDVYKNIVEIESLKEFCTRMNEILTKVTDYVTMLKSNTVSSTVQKCRSYILEHMDTPGLSLKHVADTLYLNESYLSRIFKQATGESVNRFLMRCRIEKSMELLNTTSLKAYEVGEKVGMPDAHYFGLAFKKYTGKTINEFRNLSRSQNHDI